LMSETGAKGTALQLDTGKISIFDPFIKNVTAALAEMEAERFDSLVNKAGTSYHAPSDKVTEEDFDSLYNVRFKGASS
jgi:NADP-dependent 3-hydroxy acid dehydrogenase YdfG